MKKSSEIVKHFCCISSAVSFDILIASSFPTMSTWDGVLVNIIFSFVCSLMQFNAYNVILSNVHTSNVLKDLVRESK